jgi:armadillo repeat-containing protein 4
VQFQQFQTIEILVQMLNNQSNDLLVNVVGALAECVKHDDIRTRIRKTGGISLSINCLTETNECLLVNICHLLRRCAEERECVEYVSMFTRYLPYVSFSFSMIDRFDSARLLWSLLQHQRLQVQAAAAWAIAPCVKDIQVRR